MVRVSVRFPSSMTPLVETLEVGGGLLFGRDPDPLAIDPGECSVPMAAIRSVRVVAPTVSGNHLLVWHDGTQLMVRDLRSRNGSWLRLPATRGLDVGTDGDVTLELSPIANAVQAARPTDADWTDEGSFAPAVAHEIDAWLAANKLDATARAVRSGDLADALFLPIPLAGGGYVAIGDRKLAETVSPIWDAALQTLVEYVHDQNALFLAEQEKDHGANFILASPSIREAHRKVVEATARGLQLILLGETGAGKGTLARCYHIHSSRRDKRFETINCAEIDKHFAHTRLFGAKKGAYTGCVADVHGAVEGANGGTLFLDEIIELPSDVQGALLTFLDDQRYKRLGDDQWRQADVRVVCGTNADLRAAVRTGRFRADLWYRLAGRLVEIPPLRERREDITAFLRQRPLGERKDAITAWDALAPDARRLAVHGHEWQGNFRELANFVRRLPDVVQAAGIGVDMCREALREGALEPVGDFRAADTASAGWGALIAAASAVYRQRNHGAEPARTSEIRDWVEETLKPLFFARSLGLEHLTSVPERPTPSFEEMGRKLGCDATTVKNQLLRYVEIRKTFVLPDGR